NGVLTEREQQSLLRKATRRIDDEPWTAADLVLIDEAEAVADGVRRTYGHVVVDEAQDLTAMELRVLARRCPRRSMTVLGDLAQATRPGGQRSWDDVLVHLGSPDGAEVTELDLGYRVPAPIIDFANRLLPEAAPDVRPSRSVRESGSAPEIIVTDSHDDLVTNTVFGFILAYVLLAVFRQRGAVGGFDATDAVTFVFVTQGLLMVVGIFGNFEMAERIRTGDVAVDLCRPYDFQGWWLAVHYGKAPFYLLFRGLPPFLLGALVFQLRVPSNALTAVAFVGGVALAVGLAGAYGFLIQSLAFWLLDV